MKLETLLTLAERGTTHGDFGNNAIAALAIRATLRAATNWRDLRPAQQLALEEIALKMARIVTGGAGHKDSWHDIQGYAKLGEDACD